MRILISLITGALLLVCVAPAHAQSVQAELVIPPAETYVIGDPTLLYWRFKNTANEPLGFMWEGCCRLNGRLSVEREGQPVPPTPPGEALAHMFAKAERLNPGSARDFDTRLSDWVKLEHSGTYQLSGQYTGVLPSQQPQVPRGLGLWRDAARTPPVEIALIKPLDYLQQRIDREKRRGLALALTGPEKVQVLSAPPLKLNIRNTSTQTQTLAWPQCLDLWLLDAKGLRVANVSTEVESPYEDLTLPAGGVITRDIPLGADRFEGLPLGTYSVFIDLRPASSTALRVPSTVHPVRWEMTEADVMTLVKDAAGGSATGLRNPSLKLLRMHLADIGTTLAGMEGAFGDSKTAALAKELALAACLKPVAPVPGTVMIPVEYQTNGSWQLASNGFARCVVDRSNSSMEQIHSILAVRRHLGWQVGLELRAKPDTKLSSLISAMASLEPIKRDLAQPPQLRTQHPASEVPCRITPLDGNAPGQNLLRLRIVKGVLEMEHLDAKGTTHPLRDTAALENLVAASPASFARATVVAEGGLSWGALLEAVEPLARRGAQMHLHLLR